MAIEDTTPVPARRQGKNAPQPARDWTLRKRPLCPQEAGGQDPRGRRPGMAKGNHLTDHSAESQPAPAPKTYRAPGQRRQGSQHSIQPRQGRPRTTWETGNNGQKLPGCTGATRPGRPGTNSSFLAKTRGPQAHLCRENRAQNQRHTSEYKSYLFPRTGTPPGPPRFRTRKSRHTFVQGPSSKTQILTGESKDIRRTPSSLITRARMRPPWSPDFRLAGAFMRLGPPSRNCPVSGRNSPEI